MFSPAVREDLTTALDLLLDSLYPAMRYGEGVKEGEFADFRVVQIVSEGVRPATGVHGMFHLAASDRLAYLHHGQDHEGLVVVVCVIEVVVQFHFLFERNYRTSLFFTFSFIANAFLKTQNHIFVFSCTLHIV